MNKMQANSLSTLIPAAGRSLRMKSYKPLLKYDEERTFIEKIIDEYIEFGCSKIIIVLNVDLYKNIWNKLSVKYSDRIDYVINDKLDLERYYSIKIGLQKLHNYKFCFIQNCDNPFVNQDILSELFENKISNGYVSPVYREKGGHPILISDSIIKKIINSKEDEGNFREIISLFPCKSLKFDNESILANINTETEYQTFINFYKHRD